MTIEPLQFHYAKTKNNTLTVVLGILDATLGCITLPIIWNNNGLYGIIRREKVLNMKEELRNQEKLPVLNPNTKTGIFYWDEVEKLDPKIAKLLLGE